jgi:hypothetical protein
MSSLAQMYQLLQLSWYSLIYLGGAYSFSSLLSLF